MSSSVLDAFRALKAQDEAALRRAGARQSSSGSDAEQRAVHVVKAAPTSVVIRCVRNGPCNLRRSATYFEREMPLEFHGKVHPDEWSAFIQDASAIASKYPIKYAVTYLFVAGITLVVVGALCQAEANREKGESATALRIVETTSFILFAVILIIVVYILFMKLWLYSARKQRFSRPCKKNGRDMESA